jgi:small subunit ribosomal protein S9
MIGHAIESYMNQIKGQQRALEKEKAAYELGKRHLANIMGLDPNAITQDDIDR